MGVQRRGSREGVSSMMAVTRWPSYSSGFFFLKLSTGRERAQLRIRTEGEIYRVPVHRTSVVLRSRPSYAFSEAVGCHSVPISSRLTKKSFVSFPG
jgi:hypothetical protein